METTSVAYQFQELVQFMMTPLGVLSMVVGPILMVWAILSGRARWLILGLVMWIATYGVFAPLPWFKGELLFPFMHIRVLGKSLVFATMLVLLPAAIFGVAGTRRRFPTAPAIAYFGFLMLLSMQLMLVGEVNRGLLALAVYLLTFIVFGVGMSRWIQTDDDARRAIKCIVWAAVILTVTSLYHVGIDSSRVIWQGRLWGTTSNPQFMGSTMGLCITPAIFLLLESRESKLWRLFLCGAIGFMLICLVWSGSRTGGLLTAVSLVVFFRHRIGRMAVAVAVGALSLWFAAQMFGEAVVSADRLFSTHDTRSEVWKDMFREFLQHPFFGSGANVSYQESTYLAVLAAFGLFGAIPFFILMILCVRMAIQLMRRRSLMGREGTLADLVVASMAALGVACAFDSYPLALVNFHILYFFILQAIGGLLLQTYGQPAPLPVYDQYGTGPAIVRSDPEWSF